MAVFGVFSLDKWWLLFANELTVVYLNNFLGDAVIELITFLMQWIKLVWISSHFCEHWVCEEVRQQMPENYTISMPKAV